MKRLFAILMTLALVIQCATFLPTEIKATQPKTRDISGDMGVEDGELIETENGFIVHYHTYETMKENEIAPTCTTEGSYERVVYCAGCDTERSREMVTVEAQGHTWTSATCTVPKTCTTCGAIEGTAAHNVVNELCVICEKYGTCGDNLTWSLDESGTLTISGTGPMKDRSSILYGYDQPWRHLASAIRRVVIEDGVTSIGKYAFIYCSRITSVTIPKSVTIIDRFAFGYCSNLSSVTIPDGVTSIGDSAFSHCYNMSSIIIPKSVISIDGYAFYKCGGLKNVTYCGTEEQWKQIQINDSNNESLLNKKRNYHNFVGGDCTAPATCTICGEPQGEGPKHTYTSEITKQPTLNEEGVATFTCSVCGDTYTQPVAKLEGAVAATDGFKYATLEEAIAAAQANDVIILLENIELTDTLVIPADKTITLDLNGKTISQTKNQTAGYQMILVDGKLTINDTAGTGKISYTDSGTGGEYISDTIYNRGVLVINGGTIENLSSATVAFNGYPHAVDTYSGIRDTFVTINGGTIYCENYSAIRMFCVSAQYKADLVIHDGTVKGAIDMQNGTATAALGTLTIVGGTFETTANANNIRFANWNGGAQAYGVTASITGGNFNGGISTAYVPAASDFNKGIISGGTYASELSDYVADGYKMVKNSNGIYTVEKKPAIPTDSKLVFMGEVGLSFQDYIGMQIMFKNSTAKDYDSFYVEITQIDFEGNATTVRSTGTPYTSAYTVFEQQILSWSMTEKVTMTLYGVKGEVACKGASFTASVEELALAKIPDYVRGEDLYRAAALVDMLNFGAAVQTAYTHNEGNLPNKNLGELAQYGTQKVPELVNNNNITGTNSITVYSNNISMQSKVEFQLMVKTSALEGKTVVAMMGEKEATITYEPYNSYTIIRVACGAAFMRERFTIYITDVDGNLQTCTYDVTVEGYAAQQLEGEKAPAMLALLTYGAAVAAIPSTTT